MESDLSANPHKRRRAKSVAWHTTATFLLLIGNCNPIEAAAEDSAAMVRQAKDGQSLQVLFEQAAVSNDPKLISSVGVMLFDGVGVPVDHPRAIQYLQRAAALGRPEAQYRLALAFNGMPEYYNDPPKDIQASNDWFIKAAASAKAAPPDDFPAAVTYALLQSDGKGGVPKDVPTAIQTIRSIADKDYFKAQEIYGNYLTDLRYPLDLAKNLEALSWLGKAAAQGSSAAVGSMGVIYLKLDDPKRAQLALRHAAQMGHEHASRVLYLNYKEIIGNNIALAQDKIFAESDKRKKAHQLQDILSDPVVQAGAIIGLAAVIGLSVYDPNRKPNPVAESDYEKRLQKSRQDFSDSFALRTCINPANGSTWSAVGSC